MFLDPQDEVGPSISSSVVLCYFVLLVYIVVLVLVVCLCPSCVQVVATFWTDFRKILNLMKIRPVGTELFHGDGRTDMTEVDRRFSQCC